jgi:actin-like ATPase involved in cell morphogenesis
MFSTSSDVCHAFSGTANNVHLHARGAVVAERASVVAFKTHGERRGSKQTVGAEEAREMFGSYDL